jgi:hypothetical protein
MKICNPLYIGSGEVSMDCRDALAEQDSVSEPLQVANAAVDA